MTKDETLGWVWGKRLSVRRGMFRYWVQYGDVQSNKFRSRITARRQACRIQSRIARKPIRVLNLKFRGDDRYYEMTYSSLSGDGIQEF